MAANIIRQMDIKKTKEADLESGRPTWFLLGLVLVLAVMFVMLEYNGGTSAADDGADSLSALLPERDDGLVPMMLPHTVLRVAEPAEADADAARKTRIVDGSPADDLRRKLFDPEALVADHAMEPLDDVLRPGPRDSSSAPAELMDDKPLDFPSAEYLGEVTTGEDGMLSINGVRLPIFELMEQNGARFSTIYPDSCEPSHKGTVPSGMEGVKPLKRKRSEMKYPGEPVERPVAYLPVFPGTNCDYDTAKAFRKAGAEVRMSVFCNLTGEDIFRSIEEMKKNISECHILALCGGFSAGDEPDGSGKFIANVLNNKDIAEEIHRLLDRGGLILGICNGFQALVKSGLLPYGRLGMVTKDSPVLFRNDINRHISQMVTTRVATVNSPWLAGFSIGDLHTIAVSHGEGKFVVNENLARQLFADGQVAFQYVDPISEEVTMESPYNPNGSYYAIEGIISPDGKILGKMGHTERYERNLFRNIEEELEQPLFDNAVRYFRGK